MTARKLQEHQRQIAVNEHKKWTSVMNTHPFSMENPKFKQATENWGAQTAANYKSVWKAESKPSLSSHLTGYINDGKFEPSSLVVKGA